MGKSFERTGGFTLIELMLAMTILAFITASVWSSLFSMARTKERVEKKDDFQQMTRIVMERINRDLSLAFIVPKDRNRTGFSGKEDSVTFTAFSHSPLDPRFNESESTLIEYRLERDPENPSLMMLLRGENKRLKDDFSRDESKPLVIIKNVKKLSFEYYDGERFAPWWDHAGVETKQKEKIPRAVKVSLTVLDDLGRDAHFYTMANVSLSRIDPTYFNPPLVSTPASKSPSSGGKKPGASGTQSSGQAADEEEKAATSEGQRGRP